MIETFIDYSNVLGKNDFPKRQQMIVSLPDASLTVTFTAPSVRPPVVGSKNTTEEGLSPAHTDNTHTDPSVDLRVDLDD